MTDIYLKDASTVTSSPTALQRILDAVRKFDRDHDASARIRDAADISSRKARQLTNDAVATVRRRPAPFLYGALGLIAIGVGAALLANPRTRKAGQEAAGKAWDFYQKSKPY